MAQARAADEVKLICGLISAQEAWLGEAIDELGRVFGKVDLVGEVMAFDLTEYYADEMGSRLLRQFVSFADLVRPDELVEAKVRTNEIEADFARRYGATAPASQGYAETSPASRGYAVTGPASRGSAGTRPVRPMNLDPGYIAPSRLVLASMKDFSHRIYLGRGVYGEVTLMYRKGLWEALPWTFPDFASGRYDGFLSEARGLLRAAERKDKQG